MTEGEWMSCVDPKPMLEFLRGKVSDRRLRLFSLACCYHLEPIMLKDRNWGRWFLEIVAVIDECFEGARPETELRDLYDIAPNEPGNKVIAAILTPSTWNGAVDTARNAAERSGWCVDDWENWEYSDWRAKAERIIQTRRLRDIFGNPFRSVAVAPRWLTETIVALATGIYTDRAFDRMPILADALEDVGCDNADILTHCRGNGPHVRGCWVVDLLLGKE